MSIPSIQHLLDEDAGKIVNALIDRGIFEERRQVNLRAPEGVNRRRPQQRVEDMKKPLWSKRD
jgi:hypothetical protein